MTQGWDKVIGLNVHVDTYEGMRRGVPRLLELLHTRGIRTTFFVPMGKDHTGWTVKRVFTRRGFVSKTRRAGVIETFGIKTLMRGLLLPGIDIAKRNASVLRQVKEQEHEVGIHGLDHVYWHDHIKRMDKPRTEATLEEAFRTFESILGEKPVSFAAPGWMINPHALAFFAEHGVAYSSDTRGTAPFYPRMNGRQFAVMQIPLTLPTLDEMIGLEGHEPSGLARYFAGLLTPGLNIMAVHTELEGKRWTPFLDSFIELALDRGYRFERLIDIYSRLQGEGRVQVCDCMYGTIRGRAGEVTLQGEAIV
jgi:peptidoglycan/xylan/chitin deacetylase (PgdA/CDA1 family)